jgi:hypothetical protein
MWSRDYDAYNPTWRHSSGQVLIVSIDGTYFIELTEGDPMTFRNTLKGAKEFAETLVS